MAGKNAAKVENGDSLMNAAVDGPGFINGAVFFWKKKTASAPDFRQINYHGKRQGKAMDPCLIRFEVR